MDVLSGNRSSLSAGTTEILVTISTTVSDSICYGCSKTAIRIKWIHLLHSSWAAESPLGYMGPYMSRYVKPGRLYEVCTRCLQGSHESEDRDLLIWDIPRCLTLAQTLPKVVKALLYLDAVYTSPGLFLMHFGMTLSWAILRSSIWRQTSVEASKEWTLYTSPSLIPSGV